MYTASINFKLNSVKYGHLNASSPKGNCYDKHITVTDITKT